MTNEQIEALKLKIVEYFNSEKFFEAPLEHERLTYAEAAAMFDMPQPLFRKFYDAYLKFAEAELLKGAPPTAAVN